MKLTCRWRIVVHGGVDGYSRLPVFLHASCNNRATTVLRLFTKAVEEYGLPSRVRCDKGGENYEVGWFMLNHPNRGPGRGSIIAGWYLFYLNFHYADSYCDCLKVFPLSLELK